MGQLGVGLPTFPHHTKVNLSALSRVEPLLEVTGLPKNDETLEISVLYIYIRCPNIMNLSRVSNPPKTGFN